MEVVLISNQLFRDNSPVKEDTILTKFIPYISLAQKMYIERILGQPLTDELKLQVKAASAPDAPADAITPANQALLAMIAPALSYYTVYQALPFHWAAIVNKGVTVRASENSNPVELGDLEWLSRRVKNDAERFAADLIAYLTRCASTYPLWQPVAGCGCCGDGDTGSAANPLDTGVFIPKPKHRNRL
jgi:hypothetical protein